MRQAAAALFGAGFTVAACYAAGSLLIDQLRATLRRDERIPLAFVLGAACLHLAIFAVFVRISEELYHFRGGLAFRQQFQAQVAISHVGSCLGGDSPGARFGPRSPGAYGQDFGGRAYGPFLPLRIAST